jgi:hypothetical protein
MEDRRVDDIIAELRALRLHIAHLETEINRRGNDRALASAPPRTQRPSTHGYAVGHRIRILNKVKKPAVWDNSVQWSEAEARLGTVTGVRERQIFFTTDNGIETWRAPNNLRNLTDNHE